MVLSSGRAQSALTFGTESGLGLRGLGPIKGFPPATKPDSRSRRGDRGWIRGIFGSTTSSSHGSNRIFRRTRGKPRVDDRRVISGIIHVLVSGGRRKDAPSVYGPRKTLYNRFQRRAAKGVWSNMFHALATAGGPPAEVLIDFLGREGASPRLRRKGGAEPGDRPLARRTYDQNPRPPPSHRVLAHRRPGGRLRGG